MFRVRSRVRIGLLRVFLGLLKDLLMLPGLSLMRKEKLVRNR